MTTSTVGKWLMDSGKQLHLASTEIVLTWGLKTGDPITPEFYLATALLRGWNSGGCNLKTTNPSDAPTQVN